MNHNRHRVVFNATRGQRMAVNETASSLGSPSSPPTPALAFAALLLMLLAPAQAQVVADPSAPGNQRPTILQTANGLPQINIQTPSAAGVSRNTYRQFDVQSNGVILNNSRTSVQTQIGGFVSGNPWISTPARVILNEVNSSNPSYLKGPVEVAGQRAEVVIANPSGIRVNGGSFINASGVTLTTGTPVMNSGNLESFRVAQGAFVVEGLGLDTRTADYTTILARAMEVNAGLWAKHLKVVTGANQISADASTITATPASAQGTAPRFMLDVAAIGGMYAGHIYLVGTEAGLGVNNGGVLSADAGDLVLDSNGWLRNKGTVQASGNVAITTQGEVKNDKDIYAGGALRITTSQALTNSVLIAAHGDLTAEAHSVHSTGALAAGLNTDGSLKAGAALLDVQATQQLTAQGHNLASGHLKLEGQALNIAGSQTQAKTLELNATGRGTGTAPGSGLIDAQNADVLAHGRIDIDGKTLKTTDAQLQGLGDIEIHVDQVNNRAGLVRSGGRITAVATDIDNRDTRAATSADPMGLIAPSIDLTTGSLLNQSGTMVAENKLSIVGRGQIQNAQGLMSAGGTLGIRDALVPVTPPADPGSPVVARALAVSNTGGTLIADKQLSVAAKTLSLDGSVLSQQDIALSLQGEHTHAQGSRIVANRHLAIDIEDGGLQNNGQLVAGGQLLFTATSLDNTASGEIGGTTTTGITVTERLGNRGLIDGKNTRLQAQTLNNIGTGRLYGDVLAIQADTLLNDTETVGTVRSDAVIAARERLDIGVQELINREGATVLSLGDLAIGGSLDATHRADGVTSGMAQKIQNQSATIEALGALTIAAKTLENTNTHFLADLVTGPTTQVLKVVHNGVSYDPQALGMNFGPLNSYVDNAGFRLLLTSSDYPFSAFPGDVNSWAARDTGVFIEFGLGDLMSNDFGPRVPSPFAVDYSRRRIRECRDCDWKVVDNYTAGHGIWAKFGVTPFDPASGDAALKSAAQDQLDQKIADYNLSVASRTLRDWTVIDATATEFTPVVKSSRPAQLLAGGNLSIQSTQAIVNDKSEIVAGGTLGITGATLRNIEADVLARTTVQGQSVYSYYIEDCGLCNDDRGHQFTPYAAEATRTVGLPVSRVEQRTAPPASPLQIGAQAIHQTGLTAAGAGTPGGLNPQAPIVLPTSALFRAPASSTANYLRETDPRFTDERQWRSSDYLLQALSIDPATIQKRLGDGFYEQRLVREQIASLTGLRFLGDYTSDDAQYQALMTDGATFAQAFQLRPGIALTAAQVALLTSDIVWLVERPVLPSGISTVMALVPQIYLMPREGDLTPTGSLLGGAQVQLDLSGDLTHAGTIAGRDVVQITAQNIHQLGGRTSGEVVNLNARENLKVIGGQIVAKGLLSLQADGGINIRSTTQTTGNASTSSSRTKLDRVAALYVTNPGGTLVAMAGGNLTAQGATIRSEGNVTLQALGDIALSTLNTEARDEARWDEENHLSLTERIEIGSTVTAAGQIILQAGGGITARAANLQADGDLALQAGGSVLIEAGERTQAHDEAHHVESSGWLSSSSSTTRNAASATDALASSLGGQTVSIRSDQDVGIVGSNVIGDQGVTVQAVGDVNIVAAQTRFSQSDYKEVETSGFSLGEGSVSWGTQNQGRDQQSQGTGAAASTVGAIAGNVNITAGQTYTQVGSDVMAPGGDITINAQEVRIAEARETRRTETKETLEQSGITLGVSTPLLTAMQSVAGQMEAANDTKDGRMQGLAAANSAFAVNNALNQAAEGSSKPDASNAQQAGGVNFSISIGASSSESNTLETSDTARCSSVSAGGSVSITASGKGKDSDIVIRGSEVNAGHTASLNAEGDIELLAAQNAQSLYGSNKSDSGSIGISFGTDGFGINASASSARGKEAGDDLTHSNTHITAGKRVNVQSGGDTTLQGTLVKAESIEAKVRGNLRIESLQDTSTYDSKQSSVSASVTIGVASGSFNASKSKVNSDFASVAEQSGFKAGDGGFRVKVQGDTALIGGAIASNQVAVAQGLNEFSTGGELSTIDIQNKADYSAQSTSVGAGGGSDGQKKGMSGVGVGVGSDSGHASTTTTAGISEIAGNTTIRSTDAEAGIARIFEKERVQKEINAQTKITEMFGREASKAIGDYAATQMKQAGSLRAQASTEIDPDKQAQLNAQADQLEADWGNNGKLRLLAHTVVGGLTGGASGAMGAATGTLAAPAVAHALADAGIDGALASALTAIASTAVGVAAGGTAGGAAALNEVANNYLKHADVQKLSRKLKGCGTDKACRDQAFEEAYRASVANDIALLNCKSTANCDALKAEYRPGYEAIGRMLDAGISPEDVGLVLNMETNAQTIIRNGLDQIQCSTAACKDKANHLVGIGKGLAKITPAGLVTGSGVMAYELTTALLNIGLADTAVAVARGLAELPADIRDRLDNSDPQVRGEALVDALAIGTVATAVTAKMGQLGYTAVVKQVEAKAARAAEAEAIAKAKVENNLAKDGGTADPSRPMSATGSWTPANQITVEQANTMVRTNLPPGTVNQVLSADTANAKILENNPNFKPSYLPGSEIVEVTTSQPEKFVRVSGGESRPTANWIMRESDIAGLTPEQIASKFALPAVPSKIGDVTIPAGTKLQASVANGILRGDNPGGGGVQFYIPEPPADRVFGTWFTNLRALP